MLFANKKQLKDVVKNVSIKDMVNIMFKKNDKIRLKVVCHCGCEWTLYGRKLNKNPNDPTFKIKIFKSKHTCCKEYVNKNMDYKWLVDKYIGSFLADHSFSLPLIENLVYKDYVVIIPKIKLWRPKQFYFT